MVPAQLIRRYARNQQVDLRVADQVGSDDGSDRHAATAEDPDVATAST
jgi:hypothetical protein